MFLWKEVGEKHKTPSRNRKGFYASLDKNIQSPKRSIINFTKGLKVDRR